LAQNLKKYENQRSSKSRFSKHNAVSEEVHILKAWLEYCGLKSKLLKHFTSLLDAYNAMNTMTL
jgi:hypothetical protein